MRWVAFFSLLYAAVLEFVSGLVFLAAAVSRWNESSSDLRSVLILFAIACGLAVTGAFLLLRHLWAYGLSMLLALALLGTGGKAAWDYLMNPPPQHGGRGLGLEIGLALGVPALLAVVALALPPTWREVGLDLHLTRRESVRID